MKAGIENLESRIQAEARRESFSIDEAPYNKSGRDPQAPILYAGSLDSKVAFFGRDLGVNEVLEGQPLIGGAGKRVRQAVYRAKFQREPAAGDIQMTDAVSTVLLTNTVPYKPVGNKAYSTDVKERFRPFVIELLTCYWHGETIITMGNEAFHWFKPYADKGAIDAFWKRDDRYESSLKVILKADCDGRSVQREVTLAPLPHPSPLNRTYMALFPGLLNGRLAQFYTSHE